MRIPESAILVSSLYGEPDEYGVRRKTSETERQVYGYYDSISAAEKFDGGRNGLNPQFRFTMTMLDYSEETVLIRDGSRYSVYRKFDPKNGTIELYCERKGGTNG